MKNIFIEIIKSYIRGEESYLSQYLFKNIKTIDFGCGDGIFLRNNNKSIKPEWIQDCIWNQK